MTARTTILAGRDTCDGTCETEAGCLCTCAAGCAGPCNQGRLTCRGQPRPMSPLTARLIRERGHWPYMLGAAAVGIVLVCVVIGTALATYVPR